jgi:hypothetical protein
MVFNLYVDFFTQFHFRGLERDFNCIYLTINNVYSVYQYLIRL